MKVIDMLRGKFMKQSHVYRIELPIGNELSDGDRASIYGWPNVLVGEGEDGTEK